ENLWQEYAPRRPFEYTFLDQELASIYESEDKLSQLFNLFASLAAIIACLGLLGLASFSATQRIKEIGIRKVLGASIPNIFFLLSSEFMKLILLANLFAWPIAYFAMTSWLQEFSYRIDIGWWMFVLAGGLALLIALLTVSWQAIRAALTNPVEALRYE
nr:ABC transporter permease [Fodinibius sp.]NIV13730.1 ABC transporter permease [Fodinibius sp.]NIV98474.1 ABC transporter permease [Candidatus Saccharibacteria bacterium]NIY27502.1 ABC transporter permease [Fodinibius sp.]